MLNIAICDDDIQTTGQIEMMIQKIAKRNFADVDIEVFWNGESLADSVVAGDGYDIIYLDIEMNNEDGISTAKRIRKYDKNVLIIYVTSHENYMKESFSVRPFQFLVKPVSEKQMETCFMAAYEDINSGDFYFRYSYQRMNHKVLIRDILYFESSKRKVFIVTREETFVFALELAAARISAKCPESLAVRPNAVSASVTISDVVARSSPDAAARFMIPSIPSSMSEVFHPAIAM